MNITDIDNPIMELHTQFPFILNNKTMNFSELMEINSCLHQLQVYKITLEEVVDIYTKAFDKLSTERDLYLYISIFLYMSYTFVIFL